MKCRKTLVFKADLEKLEATKNKKSGITSTLFAPNLP